MCMSQSDDEYYMKIADLVSTRSHDNKYKVGCVIVRDRNILAEGYNGVPSGMIHRTRDIHGDTLPTVIHSEANALMKLARNGISSNGATIYCTYSPCFECAKLLLQAGIKKIVYQQVYDIKALEFLTERIEYERLRGRNSIPERQSRKDE